MLLDEDRGDWAFVVLVVYRAEHLEELSGAGHSIHIFTDETSRTRVGLHVSVFEEVTYPSPWVMFRCSVARR